MDLLSTSSLFQQFLNERRFLHNVTPATVEYYETGVKALQRTSISCNTYIKALNAFCKWLHDEGHLPHLSKVRVIISALIGVALPAEATARCPACPRRHVSWQDVVVGARRRAPAV